MLWLSQPLVMCAQLGVSMVTASALSVGSACTLPKPSPVRPAMTTNKPVAVTTAVRPVPNFLPEVSQEPIPLPLPEPPRNCAIEICLALTFDDGPDPRTTPQLLDVLADHQVKATFFMLGSQAAKYPGLVRRVAQAGHEIGNHSWIHANFTKLTPPQMLDDFTRTQQILAAAGAAPPRLFRPPYGARNDMVRQAIPVSLALWNIDPKDWRAPDPAHLAATVVASAKPGGVIVMHDTKPITADAAPIFLRELKQKYHLVTISDLLALTPETPKTEFYGR